MKKHSAYKTHRPATAPRAIFPAKRLSDSGGAGRGGRSSGSSLRWGLFAAVVCLAIVAGVLLGTGFDPVFDKATPTVDDSSAGQGEADLHTV